jgi:NAD(P)-dependent dehydrogenase (short-subunit alcohol dehydrogenase family)
LRIVQFTPPGSSASVTFGQGLTTAAPGSAEGGLIVSDIEAAHDELAGRGIDASEIWHGPPFPVEARQPGPDPDRTSYQSFFSFTDPDGNAWLVQEVTTRLPGRVNEAATAFASTADLASALRRAEVGHAEHHKRTERSHLFHRSGQEENWPAWYAAWSLTNSLRLELAPQGTRVTALHVGYMDTDLTRRLDVPKSDPAAIAKLAIDGIEAGDAEIIADEISNRVLAGLSAGVAGLYPQVA